MSGFNEIEARLGTSPFTGDDELVVVAVDGVPLFDLVVDVMEDEWFVGLVSTLSGAFCNPPEGQVVEGLWRSAPGTRAIVPVLLCPDCAEFSCNAVVVEQVSEAGSVTWQRMGLWGSDYMGPVFPISDEAVRWSPRFTPRRFERAAFDAAVDRATELRRWWWPL